MKSTAKAQAWMRDLSDKLSKELAAGAGLNTVRAANDANGWPMLFISHAGNEAEAQPVLAIRISAVDAVSRDVFGNDNISLSPHILERAYELALSGAPEVSALDIAVVSKETDKLGIHIQVKQVANGTAVTEASMNATPSSLDVSADLYWPTKGQ